MDAIVFNQDELLKLTFSNYICICDNKYTIPTKDNTSYFALGKVTAEINLSKSECIHRGIIFLNFTPNYLKKDLPIYANVPLKWSGYENNNTYNLYTSYGSFKNSNSSFLNYVNSYMYEYEYEYKTSFSNSYLSSYAINSSFTTSYTINGSYKTFIHTSFLSSFKIGERLSKIISSFGNSFNEEYISVNGYGINLI